ncbi:hypothetical protein [Serratia silvae]|uniref:Uncharacterized protein n=1 Tax=Serratia silvae TaxID=2824122 RepID=A0ABT0K7M5_9GAMM|nr:hypothetical protein [Serratia silvae]MCL1028031.1 hypothetical protein [Serratia silvae]
MKAIFQNYYKTIKSMDVANGYTLKGFIPKEVSEAVKAGKSAWFESKVCVADASSPVRNVGKKIIVSSSGSPGFLNHSDTSFQTTLGGSLSHPVTGEYINYPGLACFNIQLVKTERVYFSVRALELLHPNVPTNIVCHAMFYIYD